MTQLGPALEEARRALLDLSTRNRLLSLPRPGRSRGVVILDDEDADFVAAALGAGRAFGFEAAGEEAPSDTEAAPKRRRTSKAAAKAANATSAGSPPRAPVAARAASTSIQSLRTLGNGVDGFTTGSGALRSPDFRSALSESRFN